MKPTTTLLTVILVICGVSSYAQTSGKLKARLAKSGNQFQTVRVEFEENVDCYFLNSEFKRLKTPVSERATIVIHQLIG